MPKVLKPANWIRNWLIIPATKFCATCGSGTDALTLALMAWDVKAGDAVFVSSFTFVASAEAPVLLGATPILLIPVEYLQHGSAGFETGN